MATIPGFELMTGATMSRVVDGAGVVWRGCCAQRAGNKASFGFYIFKNNVEVPYTPFCVARGQVTRDGYWTAFDDRGQYFEGPLPGFVPIPFGAYTPAPNGSTRIFVDQDGFTGQVTISLAAFGIPVCAALNVRLSLDANAGVIFRCGPPVSDPNVQAAAMLTVSGLGVEHRAYESGVIADLANRTLLIKAEGQIARGFVDVTGWWA